MKIRRQKGIALPLVMLAIMVGAIVIPSFLGRVGNGLVGSRNYRNTLDTQYSLDAAAEHAVWNLAEGGLEAAIPKAGDYTAYSLAEAVNGVTPSAKVSRAWEVIARDDFDSGDWTGGTGWTGGWSYSGEALVTSSGIPYEGACHLRLRGDNGVVSRTVDLSGQISAHLSFWAKMSFTGPSDTITCRISHDGTNWTTVYTWTQTSGDGFYRYYDIVLNPYGLTSDFYISFLADMTSTDDTFYVDDLQVVWPATVMGTLASDSFESNDWAGGTGWLAGWTNSGASSITSADSPHTGNNHLLIQGTDGYVARAVDLSEQAVAHLQFWAKLNEFESGDVATCNVSSDGVNWYTVFTLTNANDDNSYHYYDIDLTDYGLSSGFWISFSSGMNSADDYLYVDDVSVNVMRAYCITVTSGDRTLKAAVDLMGGDKKILGWWFIG